MHRLGKSALPKVSQLPAVGRLRGVVLVLLSGAVLSACAVTEPAAETGPAATRATASAFEKETQSVATFGASFAGSSSYPAFGAGWKVYVFSAAEAVIGAERVRYWRIRSVLDKESGAPLVAEYDSLTCAAVVDIIDELAAFRPPALDVPARMSRAKSDPERFSGGQYAPGLDGTLYRIWGRGQSNPDWNHENVRFSQEVTDGPIAEWHDGLTARLAQCPVSQNSGPGSRPSNP